MHHARLLLLFAPLLLAPPADARSHVTLPVSPFGAFLRVDPFDTTQPPFIVNLASIGFSPGNVIRVDAQGDFDNGPGPDIYKGLFGVFSSSSVVLHPDSAHRVPGAIATDVASVTGRTCPNQIPTDIPEDFFIPDSGRAVTVPLGAQFLMLQAAECYFNDNSDPDADFAVSITLVTTDAAPRTAIGMSLSAPRPNPARGAARIEFALARAATARLSVRGVDGRLVRVLAAGAHAAGTHAAHWDGRDQGGREAAPGVYFAHLEVEDRVLLRRVVLTR